MTVLRRLALCALLLPLLIAGCRTAEVAPPEPETPTPDAPVLLVSIDGMRWDYLDLHDAPTLSRLAERGTLVERFIPAFPTKTFPNHYTLVTGLYPSNHGVIANNMYDPVMEASFSLSNRAAIASGDWWGGEPLWVTAEEQGLTTATYFWPGSEAPIQGVRPTYWFEYDGSVPGTERVDQVLEWLDLPAEERPSFITLYFSRVDSRGHAHGPEAPETGQALREVDGFIQRLMDGLQSARPPQRGEPPHHVGSRHEPDLRRARHRAGRLHRPGRRAHHRLHAGDDDGAARGRGGSGDHRRPLRGAAPVRLPPR